MLIQVESDVLNRVLNIIESHIDVPDLRRSNRTTVNGLRAIVNDAVQRELSDDEDDSTTVAGCVACGVFNDVQHCRECGHDLTVEPIVVRNGDMEEAAQRLEDERERERERAEAEVQERRERQRTVRLRRWAELGVDDDTVPQFDAEYWMAELDRLRPRAEAAGRIAPMICGLSLARCSPCQDAVRRFVLNEQQRRVDSIFTTLEVGGIGAVTNA